MITKLLVANRAEIASRVFRTCRDLGIATVAVHSDADAELPYVAEADEAVRLPGNAPADTYLRTESIIEAARRTGAEAIHPGYGFLSENADFARAVEDAGLIWIGPRPESIEQMGSKIGAKELMREAKVPVLEAPEQPTDADLPLIVKASAGGGGRGMRIVRALDQLQSEIDRAGDEAKSAFGDGTVFVEPYVERGRHVEVQIVGDEHGNVQVFGERDCSVQRRHQKVVEEAPAPKLSDDVRAALHEAARNAALAVEYRGAGTVEFLYDAETERFYFLEMNTRLQVEHPVTEAIFGVDLVATQLAVAEHASLANMVFEARPEGHAIEVRLYAEDPAADYQPQSGRLVTFDIPTGDGVRVDSGFASGAEVSTHYDAMLAKVIVWAPTREQAARKLVGVLRRSRLHGLTTNREQLIAILADPTFLAGEMTTALLGETDLSGAQPDAQRQRIAQVTAAVALAEDTRLARTVQQGIPVGWRNVVSQPQVTEFEADPDPIRVEWFGGRDGYVVDGVNVLEASRSQVVLEVDGVRSYANVRIAGSCTGGPREVHVDLPDTYVRLREVPRFVDPADQVKAGSLLAPMPGTVVKVLAEQGDSLAAGAPVLVLEAMKMQHSVTAPGDGVLTQLNVQAGAQVAAGEVLAVVEPASDSPVDQEENQ